jgi:hypothetical protein
MAYRVWLTALAIRHSPFAIRYLLNELILARVRHNERDVRQRFRFSRRNGDKATRQHEPRVGIRARELPRELARFTRGDVRNGASIQHDDVGGVYIVHDFVSIARESARPRLQFAFVQFAAQRTQIDSHARENSTFW